MSEVDFSFPLSVSVAFAFLFLQTPEDRRLLAGWEWRVFKDPQ